MQKLVLSALTGCAFLFFILASPAMAQTATVSGVVTNGSGTPAANVTVEIQNVSSNARMRTTSDASGNYRFDNVTAGTYRMTASNGAMTGTPSDDIVIDLGRAKTVNITIQTPTSAATSTATLIKVENASSTQGLEGPQIRHSRNTRDIQYLPTPNLLERNGAAYSAYNLSLLPPGVTSNGGIGPGRGPVVGGQRPLSNNFMIEGVDNNNRANPGPLAYVSNEAITEFVSYQNQFSPEYGHTTGGQFSHIIRTGTNQVHGALYEYLQNRNLNARDPGLMRQGFTDNPRYDQNRLGANLGFPIIRDKLFMFGNFEYIPFGVANTSLSPVLAPTAAGFATLSGVRGVSQTNLGVLRQFVPPAQTASTFTTVNGVQIPLGVIPLSGRTYQNSYYGTGSLDWTISNSDSLRARYVQNEIDANSNGVQLPAFAAPLRQRSIFANVSEYHNINSVAINELRLGYNRYQLNMANSPAVFPGLSVFPNIQIAQDMNLALGSGVSGPNGAGLNTYQLADNVNWVAGRHTIRFGVDVRRYIGPLSYSSLGAGFFSFNNLQQFVTDQTPAFGQRSFGNLTFSGNQWSTYGYVNDSWRVTPTFNVNLGLRYEFVSIPKTLKLQALNSTADVPGVLTFREPAAQKTAFAPRIGFAFSPTSMHNTVFRAGFGMNYDALAYSHVLPSVPPGVTSTQFVETVTPFFGFFSSGAIINQFPVNVFNATVTPQEARALTSTYIPDQRLPYTMQWNADVQQSIGKFLLDIRYLGVKGIRLPVSTVLNRTSRTTASQSLPLFLNQPTQAQLNALPITLNQLQAINDNPLASAGFVTPIFSAQPQGWSWYNGLHVSGTERFGGGLQMQASYTWSHLIDNLSGPNLFGANSLGFFDQKVPAGNSIYDRRHRGVLTALWDVGGIGSSQPHWFRDVVANLTISGIYTYESPAPLQLSSAFDAALGGFSFTGVNINPNGTPGTGSGVTPLTNSAGQIVAYRANDPNAQFIAAGAGNFANGRALMPGLRPINNFDAAAVKRFAVRDRFSFEVHGQAYNVINHAQYVPGSLNSIGLSSQPNMFNFLMPGSSSFGDVTRSFSSHPRTLQVGLRLLW